MVFGRADPCSSLAQRHSTNPLRTKIGECATIFLRNRNAHHKKTSRTIFTPHFGHSFLCCTQQKRHSENPPLLFTMMPITCIVISHIIYSNIEHLGDIYIIISFIIILDTIQIVCIVISSIIVNSSSESIWSRPHFATSLVDPVCRHSVKRRMFAGAERRRNLRCVKSTDRKLVKYCCQLMCSL